MGRGPFLARLAVAVDDDGQVDDDAIVLRADDRLSQALFKSRRERVLFYRLVPKTLLMFFGLGSVAGYTASRSDQAIWRFDGLRRFANPVVSDAELGAQGVRRMLALAAERFKEICDSGEGGASARGGASEAGATYEPPPQPPDLGTYAAVHDEVLRRWNSRCAITGRQFAPGSRPHPHLQLVAIRPRQLGGPLHVQNYLPMIESARQAWLDGTIAVGVHLEFLAVLDRLPPELLEAMRPEGRLLVPEDPALWPNPEHLAFHRHHIFAM